MKLISLSFVLCAFILSLLFSIVVAYPFPMIIPKSYSLDYFFNLILNNNIFLESLISSIILGSLCAVISTFFGFLIGRGLVRLSFRGKTLLIGFFTIPLLFPAISLFVGIHMLMLRISLANTLVGVLFAQLFLTLPYSINIAITFWSGISKDYENISEILGASPLYTFRKILLPLLSSGIALSLSITFLVSLSEYFATFLIGGGVVVTLSGIYYPFIAGFDLQNSALISITFLLINLIVFSLSTLFINKHSQLH